MTSEEYQVSSLIVNSEEIAYDQIMQPKEYESTGQRGPIEHERRQQILDAAAKHFQHYGYKKTTVADLAKVIGLSSAYIYKFFESKQAIAEAICLSRVNAIIGDLDQILSTTDSPVECIRRIFNGLVAACTRLFMEDRKIHNLVLASFEEHWSTHEVYHQKLLEVIRKVILRGRESGEFERKTPLEETVRAITTILKPYYHPVLLMENIDRLNEDATLTANLVLRSLSN